MTLILNSTIPLLVLTHLVLCYQLRYVELNNRGRSNRWSERQVGVYHQLCNGENTLILLHATPNSRLQSRIMSASDVQLENTCKQPRRGPVDIHILVFSTYLDEWRWYLDDIGATCKDLVSDEYAGLLRCFTKLG